MDRRVLSSIIILSLIVLVSPLAVVSASPIPAWNELPGNIVPDPSFENWGQGWGCYDYLPVFNSGIAYHGKLSLYFDWIHSGHCTLFYTYPPIRPVKDFIFTVHIYAFSDERNTQAEGMNDFVSIDNNDENYRIGVAIDYWNDKLVFFTEGPGISNSKSIPLPMDRWVKVTVIKNGDKAYFYVDNQYKATLQAYDGLYNEVVFLHDGYHGPWVADAVSVVPIPETSHSANGGTGTHYEDTAKNVLKAEAYAFQSTKTAQSFITYKLEVTRAGHYTIYIPIKYRLSYGIEMGGYLDGELTIRITDSNGVEKDVWKKTLVYESGAISVAKTIQGTLKYVKQLDLDPGTYYLEVILDLYVQGWDGEAYIDAYGSNLYVDLFVPGLES